MNRMDRFCWEDDAGLQFKPALPAGKRQHKLFVYGTLKRGFRNHHLLTGKYLTSGRTVSRFKMWGFGFPRISRSRKGLSVEGELYQIDDKTLARCDALEGVPHHYQRKRIKVTDFSGKTHLAWVYLQGFDRYNYRHTAAEPIEGRLLWRRARAT